MNTSILLEFIALVIVGEYGRSDAHVPRWLARNTKLCYEWYPDGDSGQCGGGAARRLCTRGLNTYTPFYRDDTDNRGGGCRMRWGIESPSAPWWFKYALLCYRWYPDGNGGQCGGGAPREMCAFVGHYTAYYRDDTDNRGGGCRMSWRIKFIPHAPRWALNIRLCYNWYADGNGGQCGGGAARSLCASANRWTSYYRDDTDNRGGGCQMRWGLFYP